MHSIRNEQEPTNEELRAAYKEQRKRLAAEFGRLETGFTEHLANVHEGMPSGRCNACSHFTNSIKTTRENLVVATEAFRLAGGRL